VKTLSSEVLPHAPSPLHNASPSAIIARRKPLTHPSHRHALIDSQQHQLPLHRLGPATQRHRAGCRGLTRAFPSALNSLSSSLSRCLAKGWQCAYPRLSSESSDRGGSEIGIAMRVIAGAKLDGTSEMRATDEVMADS